MGQHLVFVGGGHAHLTSLVNIPDYLERGHRVTLVSPSDYHYYSGMGPGMFSGMYRPQDIRFHVKKLVTDRGAEYVKGFVVRIHPDRKVLELDTGSEVPYDVVSFNTGSSVPTDTLGDGGRNVYPVKPIINLLKARRALLEEAHKEVPSLVVIGGGAAALELAGNARGLLSGNGGEAQITVVAGTRFMTGYADKVRELALRSFQSRGIQVLEGVKADRIEADKVVLSDGRTLSYDYVFPAVGVRPSPIFRESGLAVGESGGLLVNRYLQSVSHPEMFGGGDCIDLEGHKLARVGVYAVRQNAILKDNLLAALEGGSMEQFTPQSTFMLIFNLGDGTGIFARGSWVWNGRIAFMLKDYIDRRFMKKFQVCGERQEPEEVLE